jgi:acyl-CoA synthetase (AMP-forming)/AMP-acid ligase II
MADDIARLTEEIALLTDIPRVHAKGRGHAVAVAFEGRTLTYGELDERSSKAAAMLQALGVKPGDRVAWLGRSCPEWYEVFFGAAKARACLAPINSRLAVPEIAFILQDSGADVFFVTPEFAAAAEAVVAQVDRPIRRVVAYGDPTGLDSYPALRDAAGEPALSPPDLQDDVVQLYTSGTTGLPKGVRLNNANFAAFLRLRNEVPGFSYKADETVLILMPLFHVAGTNISFAGLAAGARLIVMAEFNPPEALRLMGEEQVAHVFFAPVMINVLLQTPQIATTDFSSLKSIAYGASPISEAVLKAATERFGCGFIQFYGMTETTGAGTSLPPEDHRGELMRSCGKPWPGMEVRIADEDHPAGRLAEDRRRRLHERGRLLLRPRPGEGHDRDRRRERLSGRGRERDPGLPRRRRRGRHRRPRRPLGRGGEGRVREGARRRPEA